MGTQGAFGQIMLMMMTIGSSVCTSFPCDSLIKHTPSAPCNHISVRWDPTPNMTDKNRYLRFGRTMLSTWQQFFNLVILVCWVLDDFVICSVNSGGDLGATVLLSSSTHHQDVVMSDQTNQLIRHCIIHIPCTLLTNQISHPNLLKADAPLATKMWKIPYTEWEIAEGKRQGFTVKLVPKW
jgi:hypothetical protein